MAKRQAPSSEEREEAAAPRRSAAGTEARKLVLEVLERGVLDLKRVGLLAYLLDDGGTPPRGDCGCRIVCGCHDRCHDPGGVVEEVDER